MSTIRLQIVSAIAAALGTATGLPVFRNLDYALEDRNLPALVVRSLPDQTLDDGNGVSILEHQSEIEIVILVAESNDPEAAADHYEVQVHAALTVPASFAAHSNSVRRISGSWDFDLGDCCARHLVYQVGYSTSMISLEA